MSIFSKLRMKLDRAIVGEQQAQQIENLIREAHDLVNADDDVKLIDNTLSAFADAGCEEDTAAGALAWFYISMPHYTPEITAQIQLLPELTQTQVLDRRLVLKVLSNIRNLLTQRVAFNVLGEALLQNRLPEAAANIQRIRNNLIEFYQSNPRLGYVQEALDRMDGK